MKKYILFAAGILLVTQALSAEKAPPKPTSYKGEEIQSLVCKKNPGDLYPIVRLEAVEGLNSARQKEKRFQLSTLNEGMYAKKVDIPCRKERTAGTLTEWVCSGMFKSKPITVNYIEDAELNYGPIQLNYGEYDGYAMESCVPVRKGYHISNLWKSGFETTAPYKDYAAKIENADPARKKSGSSSTNSSGTHGDL